MVGYVLLLSSISTCNRMEKSGVVADRIQSGCAYLKVPSSRHWSLTEDVRAMSSQL